ncbi:MAG: HipA domain-containing protein [Deltaproteobacteria bacterium]|nr:HipA domain-containing protein [Deltaproteobacteria bacterium]
MIKKISIQGVQPKFSVILSEKEQAFKEVESNGTYILKPQVRDYPQIPENEDLTMHLVAISGIQIPWHGLVKCSDESLSHVIKRFDRANKEKIPMEDFSQLIGASRDTKYDVSFEKVVETIEEHCTFPTIENFKLFQRVILAFLLGNEDFHLKNISLYTKAKKVQLTPVYDFANSKIANPHSDEEMALSISDKKKNFTKADFLVYFAQQTLFLPQAKVEKETKRLLSFLPTWIEMIDRSFLSEDMKEKYKALLKERTSRLE